MSSGNVSNLTRETVWAVTRSASVVNTVSGEDVLKSSGESWPFPTMST